MPGHPLALSGERTLPRHGLRLAALEAETGQRRRKSQLAARR